MDALLPPANAPRRLKDTSPSWRKARFAIAYVQTGSRALAAIRGLRAAPKHAKSTALRYFNDPYVRETIATLMQRRAERAYADAEMVLRELILMYRTSVADLLAIEERPNGTWGYVHRFDLENAPPELLARVQELRIDEKTGAVTVKLPDKLKLLELIGKHIDVSAFEDRHTVEVRNAEDVVERLQAGRARVAAKRAAANEDAA